MGSEKYHSTGMLRTSDKAQPLRSAFMDQGDEASAPAGMDYDSAGTR